MRTRFDHIIKNALENYVAPYAPDWAVFYDLLVVEQEVPLADDAGLEKDFGTVLAGMEYTENPSDWASFEGRLDNLNMELDQEFDQSIGNALENIPESTWGAGHWDMMSARLDDVVDQEFDQTIGDALVNIPAGAWGAAPWSAFESSVDDLNMEMDQEFDQTIGDAITNLPESTWKEGHWQMLSARLDQLNDRPRLIMIKVIEAAAILLLLIQLTNLYSDYQGSRDYRANNLSDYINELLHPGDDAYQSQNGDLTTTPALPGESDNGQEQFPENTTNRDVSSKYNSDQIHPDSETQNTESTNTNNKDASTTHAASASLVSADRVMQEHEVVMMLPAKLGPQISYRYEEDLISSGDDRSAKDISGVTPQLSTSPTLINYDDQPGLLHNTSPRLGVRDINLLTTMSSDSVLNSIPVLQVIRPRIHSSMEVGILADATNVEVPDYSSLSQKPFKVPTLNAGMYFRYKIQYQDMFGSLGGDYLQMKYDGVSNTNELSMITLPVELGYNVVNLPAIRMYFSGGIAGRFVPLANYSTETFNQASDYDSKSNKSSNGLLHNGPFEINSYFSGRLSAGMDINVNKKTSINLRYSHDIWLKGRGIGYNLDKFRSSHLALGVNYHF